MNKNTKKENKKEGKECPLCNISEETIKRLRDASKDKKNLEEINKKQ